jgi:SnoaL-like protein
MANTGTVEDRLAIVHVIQQVARAFDEKLHDELLPKCFDAQARVLYRLRGRQLDFSMPGGVALYKHFHDRCYWTQHLVSPHVVEIDGDRARASTPVHAVHLQVRDDGSHNHWVIAAVYHDALVRGADGWRIAARKAICPYVEGDFLESGVRLFPTLPTFD